MRILKIYFILFFCCLFFCNVDFFSRKAYAISVDNIEYNFSYNDRIYKFKTSDFNLTLSEIQKQNFHNNESIKKLEKLNFNNEEILKYIYPEIDLIFNKLNSQLETKEIKDEVFVEKNKCKIIFKEGKKGKFIDKQKFYNEIFNEIKNNKKIINHQIKIKDYKTEPSASEIFKEKSCFTTNFETSSESRKNNIKVALKSFDGLILEDGEILSFNQTTGERKENNGYQKAKIISNGTFIEDYGGGVCQVSTTLYNACLLAGLDIIEANNHSLPVSYIEPSFDAMVNSGSSDLKIRNNTGGKIIITTSSENNLCKVKIFGLKNKFKITRYSEKIKIIKAEKDIIDTNFERYNINDLSVGEEKRLSFSKDGFVSRGYLKFYDEKGKFIKTQMIRENRYNPTKGIIVKREK